MTEQISNIVIIGTNSVTSKQKSALQDLKGLNIELLESSNSISKLVKKNILLIINLTNNDPKDLVKLSEIEHKKASIIIIGDKQDANLLSIAISANISAFLDTNYNQGELVSTIQKTFFKLSNAKNKPSFNVFINAKGGAGASFISSNIAYILSNINHSKVALADLDLQFGSVGLNFNINSPRYTIIDALNEVDDLDKVSLAGYMEKYNQPLSLLLPSTEDIVIPGEVTPQSLDKLLTLLRDNYNHLIIDLPRLIDPLSIMAMEKADNIVIVLQQNLAQFRDGRRLIHILNKDLEIDLDRIVIIINRYDKNNSLKKEDMVKIVNHDKVYTVANDYDLVATTSNLGVPLYEHSKNSKIAKNLKDIAYALGNIKEKKKKKFLGLF